MQLTTMCQQNPWRSIYQGPAWRAEFAKQLASRASFVPISNPDDLTQRYADFLRAKNRSPTRARPGVPRPERLRETAPAQLVLLAAPPQQAAPAAQPAAVAEPVPAIPGRGKKRYLSQIVTRPLGRAAPTARRRPQRRSPSCCSMILYRRDRPFAGSLSPHSPA